MTMQEFCRQSHISKPTVYKRIREAGIDLNSLRDADGNLTAEAISTLSALIDSTETKHSKRTSANAEIAAIDTVDDPVSYATLLTERDGLRRELDDTRAQLAAAKDQILTLQAEALRREREHADAWKQFSERQQEIEAQKLLAAEAGADGRSIWQRFRDKFRPDKNKGANQ